MKNELVEAIKQHALRNYEGKYGWSEIVECFGDEDIKEQFVDEIVFGPLVIKPATTPEEAIKRASEYVDLKEERYREAVGPDVKCPTCGEVFPENTACRKCR